MAPSILWSPAPAVSFRCWSLGRLPRPGMQTQIAGVPWPRYGRDVCRSHRLKAFNHMVGQFLSGYIKRCGLETEDVPKVAALFLGAKYCVWGASVALAVRYRPLRRLFLSRRQALLGEAPFSTRKRPWLVEALQRGGPARATAAPARTLKKLPSRVRKAGPWYF